MRPVVLIVGLAISLSWMSLAGADDSSSVQRDNGGQPFAVVELFTSEGCSSCPSADEYLRELTTLARRQNLRIFTVGFHVDYWDYLGWPDPYAQKTYTDRQRRYAQVQNASSIYTPQMIVNGTEAFGGFRRDQGQQAIERALRQDPAAELQLAIADPEADKLRISYTTSAPIEDTVLHIALVERGIQSDVKRGENAGKLLGHDNSVRRFKSMRLAGGKGDIRIELPTDINLINASIIGYVQQSRDMKIIAANFLDVSDAGTAN